MREKTIDKILFAILVVLLLLFMFPIAFILMNSFKGKLFISASPFSIPNSDSFVGLNNYIFSGCNSFIFSYDGILSYESKK